MLWYLVFLWSAAFSAEAGTRIVGGYEPLPHTSPFVAQLNRLVSGDGYFCCGSLINTLWVVSAAHCRMDPTYFSVVLGDHDRLTYEGTEQDIAVLLAINHPLYNPAITDNDVMMLKLMTAATINQYVQLAVLPDSSDYLEEGHQCVVCGWGYSDYVGSTLPSTLHCVEAVTVTNEQCNAQYYGEITASMLCAASNAQDACNGDSGGPFMCNGLLHGITSTGFGCGYPNFPGIYARVTVFVDWIYSIMLYF